MNIGERDKNRIWILAAFLAPLIPAFLAASQGFNLLDDGLWLLGARILMSGGCLYRDLFAIYGPAKFVLLMPFFAVMGQNALALAALKAVTLAIASGLGFAALRRRVPLWAAWLMPLGALALWANKPRYVMAGALALATAWCLEKPRRVRMWFLLGLGWAATASFGFDGAVYGVAILAGTLGLARQLWPGMRRIIALILGGGSGLALLMLVGLLNGALGDALWDTVVYPLTRFENEMGISPLESFVDGDVVGALFVDHQTGEAYTEAWPGHRAMLGMARRLLYLGLFLFPPLGAWMAWRRGSHPLLAALSAFALAGWMTAAVRGEVSHLGAGWLGTLWLLPLLVEELGAKGLALRRIALALFVALALVPLALEPVWLATHASRPGLAVWERDTAGIRLALERVEKLEVLAARFDDGRYGAAVFWPTRPGLNFFFDAPLASPQATLLGGEGRDPEWILAELIAKPGHSVLIHPPLKRDRNSNKEAAPEIWAGLRQSHRVSGYLTGGPDEFTVLTPLPDNLRIQDISLGARLYDEKAGIADAFSPTLGPQSYIGQSLPVGPALLCGMAVRIATLDPVDVSMVVRVRTLEMDRPGEELGRYQLDLKLKAGQNLYFLPFGPVPGSASRTVLVEFGLKQLAATDVTLLWHQDGGLYSGGHAFMNGKPIQSTLYFISF